MLKDLEAINLISRNISNIKVLFLFLKNDCKINIEYKTFSDTYIIGAIKWTIIYNDSPFNVNGYFNNLSVENAITTVFDILSDEDKYKIKNQVITFSNGTKDKINNKDKISLIINNANNNNNNNNLLNLANMQIETYSDLRSFIENNASIDDISKQDMINTIKEIEKAKDKKDFKSYVDLYSKLLTSLQATLNISPFIIQGFEWLKNLL